VHIAQRGGTQIVVPLVGLLLAALAFTRSTEPAGGASNGAPHRSPGPGKPITHRSAPPTTYDVYGVRFAGYHNYPVSELVRGADTARRTDLAFIVWVLKPTGRPASGDLRTVLFDAGFYRRQFLTQWKPFDFVRPSEAVGKVGVRPADVTDIIISHIHWDHLDGADLFPRARIWLQHDEYEHYVDANGMPRADAIDTVDAQMLDRLRRAGRIGLIDGDAQTVLPGITAYTGGRHTYASEYITVQTPHGVVVLASDNMYTYENLAKHVPITATFSPADSTSNLRAQDRMRGLVADPRFILPGHDPTIFDKFSGPAPGVVEIE
jgi:glyoxylase-like metal-dependent hydrolase (beta-lactamase superfamily II)